MFTNAYGERVGDGNLGWNPGELLYGGGYGYESEPGDDMHGGLTLDYVGDRYYDPTIGRFISPDPIGLSGSLNLYAYAGDDPVNNVDPSGDLTGKDLKNWYYGGMGGLSDWVDRSLFFDQAARFGQTAGCYDSGGASGWDVAREGGKAFGLAAAYGLGGAGLYRLGASALPALLGRSTAAIAAAGATGTVWDSITATQENYPDLSLPRSFVMATENGDFWVHPNATEHIAEYAQSVMSRLGMANNFPGSLVDLATQGQLTSLRAAVTSMTNQGIVYDQLSAQGGWRIVIGRAQEEGQLPVIFHALP